MSPHRPDPFRPGCWEAAYEVPSVRHATVPSRQSVTFPTCQNDQGRERPHASQMGTELPDLVWGRPMEVAVTQILGWQRNEQGCTVVLGVDIGGTVRETLRLTLPTNAEVVALGKVLSEALCAAGDEVPMKTPNAT